MPTQIIIELDSKNKVGEDWRPALKAAALEVQALNQYVVEGSSFPRPIACNPDSLTIEGFLGDCNTPPSADGMVVVALNNYDWLNYRFLPAQPTTFSFIGGIPPQAGKFVE